MMQNDDIKVFSDFYLLSHFPAIPWSTPVLISNIADETPHYGCRFCIARLGLKGSDVRSLPLDPDEVARHIRDSHPHNWPLIGEAA